MGFFADSLRNLVTRLGTSDDKAEASYFDTFIVPEAELTAVHRYGGIGGKIVDCVADDIGRGWRDVTIPEEDPKPFHDFEIEINEKESVVDATRLARLYGGSAILVEIKGDEGMEEKELDFDTISKYKPITGLRVLSRHDFQSSELERKTGKHINFIELEDGKVWHPSRVVGPFFCVKLTRGDLLDNQGWGGGIIERCYQSLRMEATVAKEIASLLHEIQIDQVGVRGLSAHLDGGAREQKLVERYALNKILKSTQKVSLYDLDNEEPGTTSTATSLGGLAPLLEKSANRIAAECDIPMTRLYGAISGGLQTSGETNMEDYHAMVGAYESAKVERHLRRLDRLICMSVYGNIPEGFVSTWRPLSEPSKKEQAETGEINAKADAIYKNTGILTSAHIVETLADDSRYDIGGDYVEYVRGRDGLDSPDEETDPTINHTEPPDGDKPGEA